MKLIIIVGAGIAGLQAARILQQNKIDFLLIEKSTFLGGRVQSENFEGFILDHGFQVLQTAYPEVQKSMDLLNLDLTYFDSGSYVYFNGTFIPFYNPLKNPIGFIQAVGKGMLTWRDMCQFAILWIQLLFKTEAIDGVQETVAQRIDQLGFSEQFKNIFLRPFFIGVFLDLQLRQPASLFYYNLKQFLAGRIGMPRLGIGEIARQLGETIPLEKIHRGVGVKSIDANYVYLNNGERIQFSQLILATNPEMTYELLGLEFPTDLKLGSKTFYFSVESWPMSLPLLCLLPFGSRSMLHFTCLSAVNPNLAPSGKHLISVTTLDLHINEAEIMKEMEYYFRQKLTFLKSFTIPSSLYRSGLFEQVNQVAHERGIILAGDYTLFPSLQAALESGRTAAKMVQNMEGHS